METYRENDETPISYKAYCQRTTGKLKGEEMHFMYMMAYLPSFKEYDPIERMKKEMAI